MRAGCYFSPKSKFQEVSNFVLPYMFLARSFDACNGYVFVSSLQSMYVYKKKGWQKSLKWPSLKMAAKILNFLELSKKHTYLGFNCI